MKISERQLTQPLPIFHGVPRHRLAGIVIVLSFITSTLALTRYVIDGPETVVGRVLVGGTIAFAIAALFFAANQRKLGGHMICLAGLGCTTAMAITEGGLGSEALFWTPSIGLISVFFLGYRIAIAYLVAAISSVFVIAHLTSFNAIYVASITGAILFAFAVGVFFEVYRLRTEERLSFLASYHPLTKLPSRAMFDYSFQQLVARANRRDESFAVLYMDVDGLKQINDLHGHAAGDALLVEIARRLDRQTRNEERPFHISGDEFVVIAEDVEHSTVESIVDRIRKIEVEPFTFEGHTFPVRISIGGAVGDLGSEGSDVLSEADSEMYLDKKSRRDNQGPTPTIEQEPPPVLRSGTG